MLAYSKVLNLSWPSDCGYSYSNSQLLPNRFKAVPAVELTKNNSCVCSRTVELCILTSFWFLDFRQFPCCRTWTDRQQTDRQTDWHWRKSLISKADQLFFLADEQKCICETVLMLKDSISFLKIGSKLGYICSMSCAVSFLFFCMSCVIVSFSSLLVHSHFYRLFSPYIVFTTIQGFLTRKFLVDYYVYPHLKKSNEN